MKVWNYGKANVEGIQISIFCVDWDYFFQGTTVHKEILKTNFAILFQLKQLNVITGNRNGWQS